MAAVGEKPIGERVQALETAWDTLIPELKKDICEIKGDLKALRDSKAVKATVLETLRMLGALAAGLFGAKWWGSQ